MKTARKMKAEKAPGAASQAGIRLRQLRGKARFSRSLSALQADRW